MPASRNASRSPKPSKARRQRAWPGMVLWRRSSGTSGAGSNAGSTGMGGSGTSSGSSGSTMGSGGSADTATQGAGGTTRPMRADSN